MEFLMPYASVNAVFTPVARAQRARRRRSRAIGSFAARRTVFDRVETARLRSHFRQVITELSRRDVAALTPAQRASRASLIAELGRYARRGRFPRNLDFAGQRVPYFIDASGARCAMAHLVEHTGATAFAQRIAAEQNNAFIREIAGDPELVAWLEGAGLSAAEAARIQPAYCGIPLSLCVCGIRSTADGPLLEANVVSIGSDGLQHAQITAIHWQQEEPSAAVMGNYAVGGTIVTWAGEGEVGDTVLVYANDDPNAAEHTVGPGILIHDGMATNFCAQSTPDLTKENALAVLMAPNDSCSAALDKQDAAWAETHCTNNNGCSIGLGESATLAVPGLIGLIAAAWATRRLARRRVRARQARTAG
jgi:hypothetical protein